MKYSVVIPAHNEAGSIANAINALKAQTVPREDFEIIVVDNASNDNTYERALNAGADIVIKESKKGANMARQTGFENSKGEIVAFLDADCLPPPDWLQKIEKDLSQKNIAAVSGPYDYEFKGIYKIIDHIYTMHFAQPATRFLGFIFRKKAGIIIGGNFAAKRYAIEAIGGLPPLAFWGDDSTIAMLISRKVGKVLFDLDLIVKSSDTRFQEYGFFRLGFRYIREYLKAFFNADSFNNK